MESKRNVHFPHLLHTLFFVFIISLPLSSSASNSYSYSNSSIYELLQSMGLPAGLLPKEVKSYNYSDSGLLEVFLDGPCLTKLDTMAFYESEVRGNLSYGSLTGVEGLSQEELFLWLPVKDIIVDDPKSGLILIDIGVAHKQLSLSIFEDPPDCTTKNEYSMNDPNIETQVNSNGFRQRNAWILQHEDKGKCISRKMPLVI